MPRNLDLKHMDTKMENLKDKFQDLFKIINDT